MKLRKLVYALIVLMLLASPLMAAQRMNVTWNWESDDSGITLYRYQIGAEADDNWTVVDSSVLSFEATDLDPYMDYTLYLQASYDGEKWSETASATAVAMLVEEPVVEEVVEEAPAAEEVVVEVAVEEPVVEETPAEAVEAEVAEVPAAKEKDGFKFNLLVSAGANTDLSFAEGDKLVNGAFPRVALGLDFQNIVELGFVGLGLRSDISAIAMPFEKNWANAPTSIESIFNGSSKIFLDSSIDMKLMAYIGGDVVDFYLGGGAGFSVFNPRLEGADTQIEYGHSLSNIGIFSSAWYASANTGLRVRFNDTFSLAAEGNYRYLLSAEKHSVSADLVFGFTF